MVGYFWGRIYCAKGLALKEREQEIAVYIVKIGVLKKLSASPVLK